MAVVFTSPCWCGCSGSWLYLQYHHWFLLTAEDRAYRRTEQAIYPDGLPSVARQLKAEMELISDPDAALQRHPEWFAVRFPNGEWVFGRGLSSTNVFRHGRGTLVVKDSHGQIRIFFGQCGNNQGLDQSSTQHHKSLDDFYKDWWLFGTLREWVPPP